MIKNLLKPVNCLIRLEKLDKLVKSSMQSIRNFFSSNKEDYSSLEINGYSVKINISNENEESTLEYIIENESDLIAQMLDEIGSDEVVWDIGANIGAHSCILAEKADQVVSFEPYPPNLESLKKNVDLNNSKNVKMFEIALSDKNTVENISIPETTSPGDQWPALVPDKISNSRKKKLQNSNLEETKVRKGDTVVEGGMSSPNIVKIDVEGASMKVIKGMSDVLKSEKCRLVYVEVHQPISNEVRPSVEDFGYETHDISDKLDQFGFETTKIKERSNDFFIMGKK